MRQTTRQEIEDEGIVPRLIVCDFSLEDFLALLPIVFVIFVAAHLLNAFLEGLPGRLGFPTPHLLTYAIK